MNQDATTPAEAPQEVAYNTTEDTAQAFLARWNQQADEATADDSESEAQDADEPERPVAEQSDEDTADATESAQAPDEDVEIDVAGDKFKFPKTLQEHAQRIQQKVKDLEAGVTRKFQEAAEIRKQVESERELTQFIGKLTTQQTELIADLRATHRELEQLNGINVLQLHEQDPVAASRVTARLVQLQGAQQRIQAQLSDATNQMRNAEQAYRAQLAERGTAQLSKLIPNLNEQTKQDLAAYIAKRDLTPEGRAALWDAEVVAAFHDAKRYREMMAQKPVAKKPEAPAKTLRPGTAAAQTNSAKTKADALKARAFKTGSTDDIAAAFMALNSRR